MRNKRLNVPLPVLRPREERHLSPFYRPVQHANLFTDHSQDYDKLRLEVRENRGEDSYISSYKQMRAYLRRFIRRFKRAPLTLDEFTSI